MSLNVIPLSTAEVAAISTAKSAVMNAQVALDKANSDYVAAFNALFTTHSVATGPNAPQLSADGLFLITSA